MTFRTTQSITRYLLLALLAITMLASACGDSEKPAAAELPTIENTPTPEESNDTSEPAENDDESAPSGSGEPMTEAEMTRVLEEWRDCVEAEEVPGLTVSVGLNNGVPEIGIDFDGNDEAVAVAAEEKCEPLLADLIAQFEDQAPSDAEQADQLLALQKCMADKGIEIFIEDNGISIDLDGSSTLTEEDVQNAEDACFEQIQSEDE